MRKRIAAIATVLVLALTACGGEGYDDDPVPGGIIPDDEYYVIKVEVEDTDCIIYRDGSMGGISCDWDTVRTGP